MGWDMGLISFVNNEPFINKIKANAQLKNWEGDRIQQFPENDVERTNTHMKKVLDLTLN